jgi:hypothetical protein
MITITNITNFSINDKGIHTYLLKINNTEILRFTHNRNDGLAKCLRDAAEAVDKLSKKDSGEETLTLQDKAMNWYFIGSDIDRKSREKFMSDGFISREKIIEYFLQRHPWEQKEDARAKETKP